MSLRRPNMTPYKTPMANQPMPQRLDNFQEVALGYTLEQAQAEAERCLNCPDRYCSMHCPAHNYIPEFIAAIREGNLEEAWYLLSRTNPMMEISSRVCPCQQQCESHCTRGIKSEPVAIGRLERFVADWHRQHAQEENTPSQSNGHSVAIVGGGPAGLTCAFSLARSGYQVTIYEKEPVLGGVPTWGIPSFVLPKNLMQFQIDQLQQLGVTFRTNTALGQDVSLETLRGQYDAIFVATGAQKPVDVDLPGRSLIGVVQAKEYLSNPKHFSARQVLVFGGGNTAIDVARTALREGAHATLVYRRTKADMPATQDELAIAKEEGVELVELTAPLAFEGTDGTLNGVRCATMKLTAPDYPGGRNNVAPSGDELTIPCDLVVLALGFEPERIPDLPSDHRGRILVNKQYATSLDCVYAGGDAVTGAATLMKAVAAGKDAAAAIFSRFTI